MCCATTCSSCGVKSSVETVTALAALMPDFALAVAAFCVRGSIGIACITTHACNLACQLLAITLLVCAQPQAAFTPERYVIYLRNMRYTIIILKISKVHTEAIRHEPAAKCSKRNLVSNHEFFIISSQYRTTLTEETRTLCLLIQVSYDRCRCRTGVNQFCRLSIFLMDLSASPIAYDLQTCILSLWCELGLRGGNAFLKF